MRTLRLSTVAMVIPGLLWFMVVGMPALAQEASSLPGLTGSLDLGDRTLVLTTATDKVELQDSTQTEVGDILQARDLVWAYQLHATDPRLDGTIEQVINYDMRPDGSAEMWGATTVANAGGTWEGLWTGAIEREGSIHIVLGTATGTGSYEGLVWQWQGHFIEGDYGFTPDVETITTGWIEPVE